MELQILLQVKTLQKMCELDQKWDKKRNKLEGRISIFPHLSTASPPFPLVPLMNSAS